MDKRTMGRTGNSVRNSMIALVEQGTYMVMSFICRTVFIHTLGKTYLGFSGLFSDILALLSLAELGVGTAILYSMYKPAAVKDYKTLAALLQLYRKVYNTIGILILIVGICLTPFLGFFISDIPDIPELPIIYLLYLLNTTASYFFVYKKSILIVDQRSYVSSLIYIVTISAQNIFQMIFLVTTHSFIIYLVIQVCCTLINNTCISLYVNRQYAFLKEYRNEVVEEKTKQTIYGNIKAMFASKISSAIVTSTDNILISKFVSTVILGLYSNYTLFVTMLRTIITKIFEALTGSIGNLVALESSQKIYQTFRKIFFINFWIVAFSTSILFSLVNPFIELWIGDDFLLSQAIVFMICLNLYMRLIRNTFLTFMDTYGLFVELRPKCIAEAIINLVFSLILVGPLNLGVYGVLLGTFTSNILTNFWYEPYLLFVKKFNVSISVYFRLFLKYFCVMAISAVGCYLVCNRIILLEGWIGFFAKGVFCCIGINVFYFILFRKTEECRYFILLIKRKVLKRVQEHE